MKNQLEWSNNLIKQVQPLLDDNIEIQPAYHLMLALAKAIVKDAKAKKK